MLFEQQSILAFSVALPGDPLLVGSNAGMKLGGRRRNIGHEHVAEKWIRQNTTLTIKCSPGFAYGVSGRKKERKITFSEISE